VKPDAISIVEAAYDCESDTRAWFRRLLEQAARKLDRGFGVTITRHGSAIAPEEALVATYHMDRQVSEAMGATAQRTLS
jgi:hypothetical protein